MADIAALTGQQKALRELEQWLSTARIDLEHVRLLEGPSGSGKTWVAERLVESARGGFETLVLTGDKAGGTRDFYPFRPVYRASRMIDDAKQAAVEVTGIVPKAGSVLKWLVQFALNRKRRSKLAERVSWMSARGKSCSASSALLAGAVSCSSSITSTCGTRHRCSC